MVSEREKKKQDEKKKRNRSLVSCVNHRSLFCLHLEDAVAVARVSKVLEAESRGNCGRRGGGGAVLLAQGPRRGGRSAGFVVGVVNLHAIGRSVGV